MKIFRNMRLRTRLAVDAAIVDCRYDCDHLVQLKYRFRRSAAAGWLTDCEYAIRLAGVGDTRSLADSGQLRPKG